MKGEAGILQQRVEAVAGSWRRWHRHALERIRREENEGKEADADQRLDGEHAGAQAIGKLHAEGRHRRAEQRQYQRP